MEQILTVTHRNGSTFDLAHKGTEVWGITAATQSMELNANDTVTVDVQSTAPLAFALGDTITVYGKTYTMNELPKVTKNHERKYVYKCTFEGEQYYLLNVNWQMPFSAINDTYTGTLADFAALLVTNLVRLYGNGTWSVGNVPADTETKTLTFSDTNCLDVMQQMCEEWEVEFAITMSGTAHVLNFYTEIGSVINYEFEYGRVGGLYELQRNGVNDPDFGTRIYFYGGSDNISNAYFNSRQSPRLCLAYKQVGTDYSNNPTKNNSYLEQPSAVNAYGYIERIKVFEDIYPNRIGTVTAIDAQSELKFTDNTMFDLNEKDGQGNTKWLIAGTTAKVHFNTGLLAGYDLDISKYDHATHTFTINPLTDENNYVFPSPDSNAFRIAVGDEYILVDIVMPNSYVTAAQNKLQSAAQDWYNKHCAPAVEYTMTLSQQFVERLAQQMGINDGVVFHIGDKITITDAGLGIAHKQFRITNLKRNLRKKYDYTLTIAETNLLRARYNWRRKAHWNRTLFDRLGLNRVGYAAEAANQVTLAYRGVELGSHGVELANGNATRIGYIIDNNNKLRPAIIPNNAIVATMLANELAQKIAHVQTLERYINNGLNANRHYSGTLDYEAGKVVIKDFALVDAYTKEKLNHPVSQWECATEVDIDFTSEDYGADKAYHIYADVKEDGSIEYVVHEVSESVGDTLVRLGTVSAEVEGQRTFTRCINEAYMEDGQLKAGATTRLDILNGLLKDNNGNTLLDLISGYIEGATKIRRNNATTYSLNDEIVSARTLRKFFTGSETGAISLKDEDNNDTDLQTILGMLPNTAGGLRKRLFDAEQTVDGITINNQTGKITIKNVELLIGTDGIVKVGNTPIVQLAKSADVPTITELNTRLEAMNTLRNAINQLYSEMGDWNSRIATWTTQMQAAYGNTPDFPQSASTCAHTQAHQQQCAVLPAINDIVRN